MRSLLLLWLVLQLPLFSNGQGYFDYIFFHGTGGFQGHGLKWNHSTRLFDSIPYPLTPSGVAMQNLGGVNDCYGQMLYYIGDGGRLYNHLLDTFVNYRWDSIGDFKHMPIKVPNSNGKFLLFKRSTIGNNLEVVPIEPLFNNRQGRIIAPSQTIARNLSNISRGFRVTQSSRENELLIFCVQLDSIGRFDVFVYSYNILTNMVTVRDSLERIMGTQAIGGGIEINSDGTKLIALKSVVGIPFTSAVNLVVNFDTSNLIFTDYETFTFPAQHFWHFKNNNELYGLWVRSAVTSLHKVDLSSLDSTQITMSHMVLDTLLWLPHVIDKYYENSAIISYQGFGGIARYLTQLDFSTNPFSRREPVGLRNQNTHWGFIFPMISDLMLNAHKPFVRYSGRCLGDTTYFAINDSDFVQYAHWDFGDTAAAANNQAPGMRVKHVFTQAGTYRVRLISQNCNRTPDTTFQTVTIYGRPASPQLPDTVVCTGSSLPLSLPADSTLTYRWSTGDSTRTTQLNTGGWHWVELSNPCFTTRDSFYVNLHEPPQSGLVSDTNMCEGNSLTITPQPGDYTWQWQDGSTQPLTVTAAGTYALLMTNACGTFTHQVRVDYQQAPSLSLNDTSRCEGQFLRVELPEAWQANYQWADGSSERIRVLTDSGWYSAQISNPCGTASDDFYLTLTDCRCHVYLPTAFSPNADGTNDQLLIKTRCALSSYQMEVYDRWGKLVFVSTDLNRGWDGTYQGQDLPPGSYAFVIRYTPEGRDARVEKGVVNLLR